MSARHWQLWRRTFAIPSTDQETFLDTLATMSERYLFPQTTQASP